MSGKMFRIPRPRLTLSPWMARALGLLLLLTGFATAQILPGLFHHKASDFHTYGRITSFHLDAPLNTAKPATLAQFPLMNTTYALYPTAGSGAGGMVPGNTVTGEPTMITVARGINDQHNNVNNPFEFQVIKSQMASLPKAPGKKALLVYSVLYTGENLGNCTGIVQVLDMRKGKLMLADQFSYDCKGGAGASWNQKKRELELRTAHYVPGDKPCCPTEYDHVVFKLDGDSVKTGSVVLHQN